MSQRNGKACTDQTTAHVRSSPSLSPAPRQPDDLPEFAVLTNDDDRQRKAELQRPGTYGVVVTPESFSDLPEYASVASPGSRRTSEHSPRSTVGSPGPTLSRTSTRTDPNVVVLDRFEDTPPASAGPFSSASASRRPSLPESMQYLSMSSSPPTTSAFHPLAPTPPTRASTTDGRLLAWFRQHIVKRIVQPPDTGTPEDIVSPTATRSAFEAESARFQPVRSSLID